MIGATGGSARAADTSPSPPEASDPLATARARIAEKKWSAAIDELKRVNASSSADWNSLLGYSLRKDAPPDLAGAAKFYDVALRIDPKHHGALEYSGELYLMTGDLPRAEARRATLGTACAMKCEEYGDLKQAVAGFKAAGNRHMAEKKQASPRRPRAGRALAYSNQASSTALITAAATVAQVRILGMVMVMVWLR